MIYEKKVIKEEDLRKAVAVIVGTRPGIVMFAPIIHELRRRKVPHIVIHTGQHYSPNMDGQFFEDFKLPEPEYKLKGVAKKEDAWRSVRNYAGRYRSDLNEGTATIGFGRR